MIVECRLSIEELKKRLSEEEGLDIVIVSATAASGRG